MDPTLAALVRRNDPDRFLAALFAPPERRDALLVLYAFNHELARAREVATDPTLALIRLQWWREVVEGTKKAHEVATPLSAAIATGALDPARLLPLIEARELESYSDFMTEADWRDWLMQGAGGLAVAAGAALGTAEPERCRPYGAAYGVAGLRRASLALARQQRCLLPADLLRAHGMLAEGFIADPTGAPAQAVLQAVAQVGWDLLDAASPVPRDAIPAILPAVLARRDLARPPGPAMPRGLGDRLAVMRAALTGRVR